MLKDDCQASIIVPVLCQRNDWLYQCVCSALGQTAECEVIVVTSPDTPATNRELLTCLQRQNRNLFVVQQPQATGYARAFNVGIERARTQRIGFLLSDDWLAPSAVSTCLQFSTDIVSTGLTVYAACGKRPIRRLKRDMGEFMALPSLERRAGYLKHFLLLNKEKVIEVGGVDETIGDTGPDDYDLIWMLLERSATVAFTEKPLYEYRDHNANRLTLREKSEQIADLVKILDKHGVQGEERAAVIARKSQWYGRSIATVINERDTN